MTANEDYDNISLIEENKDPLVSEACPPHLSTPWVSPQTRQINDLMLAFHSEIIDFCEYIQPSPEEMNNRIEAYEKLKNLFEEKIEGAKVSKFGSFATNLSLKNADIDLVLVEYGNKTKKLMKLAYLSLKSNEINYDNIEIIKHAKVPLIKFRDAICNCEIDLCFNEEGGIADLEFVKETVDHNPEMRFVYLVFKFFLRQRKLNNTYHGGVGSFLLFALVCHFMLSFKAQKTRNDFGNTLGFYVLGFLEYFGEQFDFRIWAIDFNVKGRIVQKSVPSNGLVVVLPGKVDNIAASCWKFIEVSRVFKNRFMFLQKVVVLPGESVLGYLVNPTFEDFKNYESY